jgi:hypothetical protein
MHLNENISNPERQKLIDTFIDDVCQHLSIHCPLIELIDGSNFSETNLTFGCYSPSEESVKVSIQGRHLMDIMRTIAHELVHHKQKMAGVLSWWSPHDLESEANTVAAKIMREWGKKFPQLFTFVAEEVAINNVGSGTIAGIGIGPQGEPGVKKRKRNLKSFKIFTRGTNVKHV